jgi:PAS domain-containing protein
MAVKHDLYVTHHGRATHVLLGIDQYHAMKAVADAPRRDDGAQLVHMLADWLDEAVILCDAEMRILFVNRITQAICRRPAQELVGRPLLEALPQTVGSLLEVHARRANAGSELGAADIRSPFRKDGWLRFQSFPLGGWNVILFRDSTDEVERHRLADVRQAIQDGMSLHGGVAYARVSVRGTIELVNEPCRKLIGLPQERLLGMALADVVAVQERATVREALEEVMRAGGSRRLSARILTDGGPTDARIALVPLHGPHGPEGAVMLATTIPG